MSVSEEATTCTRWTTFTCPLKLAYCYYPLELYGGSLPRSPAGP